MNNLDFRVGDVCIYSFGHENAFMCKVEILEIFPNPRGVARIKILEVYCDDSGNGFFEYLKRSGKSMNASLEYLKKSLSA